MKNAFILALLIISVGCKKESDEKSNSIIKKAEISSTEKYLKTDTIPFLNTSDKNKDLYILAHLLEKKNIKDDEDTIVVNTYMLDFYTNNVKIGSEKVVINPYYNGNKWSAYYGMSQSNESTSSSFIQVHIGHFNHQQYLFYLNEGKIQLVNQWNTFSDSEEWGSWIEFVNLNPKNEKDSFYSKKITFNYKYNENEDLGIVAYSDSVKFSFKNNRWEKQLMTPKEKIYWQEDILAPDFYLQYPKYKI